MGRLSIKRQRLKLLGPTLLAAHLINTLTPCKEEGWFRRNKR